MYVAMRPASSLSSVQRQRSSSSPPAPFDPAVSPLTSPENSSSDGNGEGETIGVAGVVGAVVGAGLTAAVAVVDGVGRAGEPVWGTGEGDGVAELPMHALTNTTLARAAASLARPSITGSEPGTVHRSSPASRWRLARAAMSFL